MTIQDTESKAFSLKRMRRYLAFELVKSMNKLISNKDGIINYSSFDTDKLHRIDQRTDISFKPL